MLVFSLRNSSRAIEIKISPPKQLLLTASNEVYNPITLFRFQCYFLVIENVILNMKVIASNELRVCVSVDESENL